MFYNVFFSSVLFSACQLHNLERIVLDHELSHGWPILFPRAHAVLSPSVPVLCAFCLSLDVWKKKKTIQETRPWQTALWGLAQIPHNKLTIVYLWQMQVVVLHFLLVSYSRPVSVSKSCCEDLWNGPCWGCLWCRSIEFSTHPLPIGLFDLLVCETLLSEPLARGDGSLGWFCVCVGVCGLPF